MVDRIRYPTVSYLPFYYVFFQFLLLTIFNLQANILTTKDILSNLAVVPSVVPSIRGMRRGGRGAVSLVCLRTYIVSVVSSASLPGGTLGRSLFARVWQQKCAGWLVRCYRRLFRLFSFFQGLIFTGTIRTHLRRRLRELVRWIFGLTRQLRLRRPLQHPPLTAIGRKAYGQNFWLLLPVLQPLFGVWVAKGIWYCRK